MGLDEDPTSGVTHGTHLETKANVERQIIEYNQALMSTKEGKESITSTVTVYIVDAMKQDVERLEHVVSLLFETQRSPSAQLGKGVDADVFAEIDEDEESDDEYLFSNHSSETDSHKMNAKIEICNTVYIGNTSDDSIVDGDELSI